MSARPTRSSRLAQIGIRIAAVLFYGVSAVWIAYYPIQVWQPPEWAKIILLLGIGILTAAAADWGLFHFSPERLAKACVSRSTRLFLFGAMLLAGIGLAAAYPVTPVIRGKQELRITAAGAKNTLSSGSEVAVARLYGWNSTTEEVSKFIRPTAKDEWLYEDGNLVARQTFPVRLKWQSKWLHPIRLFFVASPAGGIVEVKWNGETRLVDLYSPIYFLKEVSFYPTFPRFYRLLYYLAFGGLAGLLLYFALAFLMQPGRDRPAPNLDLPSRWEFLLYALPLVAIWGIYWLALWPGLLSPDSRNQLSQVASGNYDNWHPVFHTWTLWLITRAWNSPAAIALFQMISMAGVAGAAYVQMARAGTPRIWRWVGLAFFGLSIVNSLLVITLWKDILFTVAFLLFFIFCVDLISTHSAENRSWIYWAGFLLVALLISLYRHNGITIVPITMAFLFIFLKELRSKIVIFSLVYIAIILLLRGPFVRVMQVENTTDQSFLTMFRVYHIASHVVAGEEFTRDDQAYLNQILPFRGDWNHSCYHPDSLLYRTTYQTSIVAANPGKFQEIFINTFRRDPRINLRFIGCSSSLIWRITQTPYFNAAAVLFTANPPGSKLPQVVPLIYSIYRRTLDPALVRLVWRPAVYLYLFLFGVLVKTLNNRRRFLLLTAPIIGLCLPLVFIINNQDFRFLYPVVAVTLLYWPYLLFSPRMSE